MRHLAPITEHVAGDRTHRAAGATGRLRRTAREPDMAEPESHSPKRQVGPAGPPVWRKSSYSNSKGNCVECAVLQGGHVAIRDSTRAGGGMLRAGRGTVAAFVRAVGGGRLGAR